MHKQQVTILDEKIDKSNGRQIDRGVESPTHKREIPFFILINGGIRTRSLLL